MSDLIEGGEHHRSKTGELLKPVAAGGKGLDSLGLPDAPAASDAVTEPLAAAGTAALEAFDPLAKPKSADGETKDAEGSVSKELHLDSLYTSSGAGAGAGAAATGSSSAAAAPAELKLKEEAPQSLDDMLSDFARTS
jgi:hypothetical protein